MVDCSRCAGLCCVALAFDRSEHFAIDKQAGAPCPHLGTDNRCRIHEERAAQGFGGCLAYDCHGAGPRAVESVGRSWRQSADAAAATFEAFRVEREVVRARELLEAARTLPLAVDDASVRAALASELAPETWPEVGPRIASFLRKLRRLPLVRSSQEKGRRAG